MIRYGTGFSVDAVFFTHFHADHYLGIIGFLRTLRPPNGSGPERTKAALAGGGTLEGLVMNQSTGDMQDILNRLGINQKVIVDANSSGPLVPATPGSRPRRARSRSTPDGSHPAARPSPAM